MFEWGPIKEKLQQSNFELDDEYDKYTIQQTPAPGLFEHATGLPHPLGVPKDNKVFGQGTLNNQGNVKGAHPPRDKDDTPFVFNTLVQTPLWLDNCNNF